MNHPKGNIQSTKQTCHVPTTPLSDYASLRRLSGSDFRCFFSAGQRYRAAISLHKLHLLLPSESRLTDEFSQKFSPVCLYRFRGVYLRDDGPLSRQIGSPTGHPYPAHSIHPSSTYDVSSLSVDIQGVRQFSKTRMMSEAGSSEGPMVRYKSHNIASPDESLEQVEQPVQGDLDTLHSWFTVSDSCGAGKKRWRTTIEMLPEDTILEIFDFYRLDAMMLSWKRLWKWHRLAHVCRKWRRVISMSPRRLDLRIICEYGAPIESILRSWPTLPLVVRFDSGESKHMPRNVVAALHCPDRLCSIDLDVTSSMTGPIVEAIQKPCREVESILVTVNDAKGPSMPVCNSFLGGSAPRLREIKLDGISFPFPAIRQVLFSTRNLVELHLFKIPNEVYFSPDDLVTGLSTLVQLERLTISFHSPASRPPPRMTRPPPQRTTLPALRFLDFHGATEYLEEFVARIDLRAFCKIDVTLFNDIFFEIPQLCKFIPRLNEQGSPTSTVYVILSAESVGIVFLPAFSSVANFYLKALCRRLDWQLSFVTQITGQLSPLLSDVHELTIVPGSSPGMPTGEDADSTEWLELFQPFTHVTKVAVWAKQAVQGIVQALVMEHMAAGVLPELTTLYLRGYPSHLPSVAEAAAEKFVATRRLSGRTVYLESSHDHYLRTGFKVCSVYKSSFFGC